MKVGMVKHLWPCIDLNNINYCKMTIKLGLFLSVSSMCHLSNNAKAESLKSCYLCLGQAKSWYNPDRLHTTTDGHPTELETEDTDYIVNYRKTHKK